MAKSYISKGLVTSRHVNPLDPDYNIPQVLPRYPQPTLKYLRNSIDVNDINGAQPKTWFLYEQRDNMNAFSNAIPNNKPKPAYVRTTPFDSINYNDVTANQRFTSQRRINPLDPQYDVRYYGGENYYYGEIDGNKPESFSRFHIKNNNALKTSDIDGAQPGTKNRYSRFNYSNCLSLSSEDIIGAKAGTRSRGIVTQRKTNPLNPDYQYLGCKEDKNYYQGEYNAYGNKLQMEVYNSNNESNKSKQIEPNKPIRKLFEKEQLANFTISPRRDNYTQCSPIDNYNPYYYNDYQYNTNNIDYDDNNYLRPPLNYERIHDPYLFPSMKRHKEITLNDNIVDLSRQKVNRELYY